eukprot:gene26469-31990_t
MLLKDSDRKNLLSKTLDQMYGSKWRLVAITGPGDITVRVTAPKDTKVSVRPALLPHEAKYSTATYTGTRVLQRSAKTDKQTGGWKQAGASQQRKV